MTTNTDLFRFRIDNLREVKRAITAIDIPIKAAIREGDAHRESFLTKLYMLLMAAKLECRLEKLLYQPDGFDDQQRAEVTRQQTQLDRWLKAVEVAFRFQYNVGRPDALNFTARKQYEELVDLIEKELRPLIELRNKLAHGQWAYALTNDGTAIAQQQMQDMKTMTYTTVRLRGRLADHICDTIHELVVARHAAKRNFDRHYRRIVESRRNLETCDHAAWSAQLRNRHQLGKATRQEAAQP
jgi:hypothetical protein